MKKIIASLLCIALWLANVTSMQAANLVEESYHTISVEYSDKIGSVEQLQVMIKDNHVYVNAETIGTRLGYNVVSDEEYVLVYNKDNTSLPFGFTQFYIGSTKVVHTLFTECVDSYEAPFSTVKNDSGVWIPFEYSLLILNSGMMVTGNTILIDIPQKDIIDVCFDVVNNSSLYTFEWSKDFGYTEGDVSGLELSSHIVNLFSGILGFESASWAQLFNHLEFENSFYDAEYGKDLTLLICTPSNKELEELVDEVEEANNLLSADGKLGNILSKYSESLDKNVGQLHETCETILEEVKTGNNRVVEYNRSYQTLEKALDKQAWFSDLGGEAIIHLQEELSGIMNFFSIGTKILEIVNYENEFINQDKFSTQALTTYIEDTKQQASIPEETIASMIKAVEELESNLEEYSIKRWFDENADEFIEDAIGEVLSTKVNAMLFVWDLASTSIPLLSSGISSAEKFELALYATSFQYGAFDNSRNYKEQILSDESNFIAENFYKLSQYYYIYLKSCFITREAALGSLAGKLEIDSNKEKLQPLIDYQNDINSDIAKLLILLKDAEKTNEDLVYGFLPSDNQNYLEEYDDSKLVEVLSNQNIDIMDYIMNGDQLVKILDLENYSDNIHIIDARNEGTFSIYYDVQKSYIFISNSGEEKILLDGIRIGDSIEDIQMLLEANKWTKEEMDAYAGDESVRHAYFTTYRNNEFYGLSLTYSVKDNRVCYWNICNDVGYEIIEKYVLSVTLEGWKAAYIDMIMEKGSNWQDIARIEYKLVNINDDSIPELYIHYGSVAEGDEIYTFYNNSLIYQHMYNFGFSYLEEQNCFIDSGGRYDFYYDRIYCIQNGEFKLVHNGEYDVTRDESENEIYNCYWDGTKVSGKEEYHRMLRNFFDEANAKRPNENGKICKYKDILMAIIKF